MSNDKFTMASSLALITGHGDFTIAHLDRLPLLTTTSLNCVYLI